ncbi:SNF2 domain-containing protein [Actinidia rufa]|uniref:SNF2 domain-containing protein n=1 Tax=Actinidia rufa TaxID=165716 RepID=A0A7J0FWQ5_9ERIC|nr:SNF2 domain-containing protein [Actinidia rufa]
MGRFWVQKSRTVDDDRVGSGSNPYSTQPDPCAPLDSSTAWFCSMNKDPLHKSCIDPEESWDSCQPITNLPGFHTRGTHGGKEENVSFFTSVLKEHYALIKSDTKVVLTWLAKLSPDKLSEVESVSLVQPVFNTRVLSRGDEHESHKIFQAFGLVKSVEKSTTRWYYPRNLAGLVFDLAALRIAHCEPLDSLRLYLSRGNSYCLIIGKPKFKSMSGLPLLKFLHEETYGQNQKTWEAAIHRPFEAEMEEGRSRLLQLLHRCMISARKMDLQTIPPCIKKVTFLDFTEEHARSYNELAVTVICNILMADWKDPCHVESLPNPKQWKFQSTTIRNVRLSCCVAGHIKVTGARQDIQETMDILVENGLDPISEEYGFIKYNLMYGDSCMRCKAWCRLPVITPCRHLLCLDCVALDSERCSMPPCTFLASRFAVNALRGVHRYRNLENARDLVKPPEKAGADADECRLFMKEEFGKPDHEGSRPHHTLHDFAESNYLAHLSFVLTSSST